MRLMDTPLTEAQSLYVLRGEREGRPYVAAAFSDLSAVMRYMRRVEGDLVVEAVPGTTWPLYALEFLGEEGEWQFEFVDRERFLGELFNTKVFPGDHVYFRAFKIPCDWMGHPRSPGDWFMDKLQMLEIDNWFLEAFQQAPEDFNWF